MLTMAKLDDLIKNQGGNIAESIGQGRQGTPAASPPRREIPKKQQGVRRVDLMEIEVDRIYPDPDQPRKEFAGESIDRMAESLKARGQIQPIMVRWCAGSERWLIVSGERRWRGAMQAELKTMKAVVRDERPDSGSILVDQLVENLVREDLSPLEQAQAFRRVLAAEGWSGNRLAQELGIKQSRVVEALALLELSGPIRERIELEEIPASTAYEFSKIADPAIQEELATRSIDEGWTREEVREEVRKVTAKKGGARNPGKGRGGKKPAAKTLRPWKFRADNGARVTVEFARGMDASGARAALAQALARLDGSGAEAAA
jgi:ParB family transcriptional regulator, chromosome partitioning protein